MVEFVALEIDFGPAEMFGHALGEIEGARAADIVGEVAVHFLAERRIGLGVGIRLLQVEDEGHQGLGNKAAAVNAEMAAFVGPDAERVRFLLDRHGFTRRSITPAAGRDPILVSHTNGGIWPGKSPQVLGTGCAAAVRAARIKARIRSGSFSPGARSTPEDTSTPGARVIASASATLP